MITPKLGGMGWDGTVLELESSVILLIAGSHGKAGHPQSSRNELGLEVID